MPIYLITDHDRWGYSINVVRASSRAEAFAAAKVRDNDRNECEELPERDGLLWCHDESPDTGPGG